jgi:hypothetical protein
VAVRVSFQHPGHAQCAPSDIEAADAMLSLPNCPMQSIMLWYTYMAAERTLHRRSTAGAHVAVALLAFCHRPQLRCIPLFAASVSAAGRCASGGVVRSSANGGAAWRRAHCATQKLNLRSTHGFRAEFGKNHGTFLRHWIALDLSFRLRYIFCTVMSPGVFFRIFLFVLLNYPRDKTLKTQQKVKKNK